jgi:taurine dioxygenase
VSYRRIAVKPLAPAIGAEIDQVDLSRPLDDETFSEIHRAFLEHLVIFFRDQHLAYEQHKEFGRRFGPLYLYRNYQHTSQRIGRVDGHPEILIFNKEKEDKVNVGGRWHADVTFEERPPLGSVLYAREIPPLGGDTCFANMYLAYETLSETMKKALDGLTAVHSDSFVLNPEARGEKAEAALRTGTGVPENIGEHPVVRTHPETGRKALFVNAFFTVGIKGMPAQESQPLLDFLYRHLTCPEFTCRFRWTANSVALWDNRCSQHYALNDYHGYRREVHRVTIDGDRPF